MGDKGFQDSLVADNCSRVESLAKQLISSLAQLVESSVPLRGAAPRNETTEDLSEEGALVNAYAAVAWRIVCLGVCPLLLLQKEGIDLVLEVESRWERPEDEGEDEDQEVFYAIKVSEHFCNAIDFTILNFDLISEVKDECDD